MTQYGTPYGGRLRALEQNILKLRAMEMALILFYAEDLRQDVLGCIRATDLLIAGGNGPPQGRLPPDAKKPFQKALKLMVEDGVLTQDETAEIGRLVDYRNNIAHQIQSLTSDVSYDRWSLGKLRLRKPGEPQYDDKALERIKHYRRLVGQRTWDKYAAMTANFAFLDFAPAERTFNQEIRRLKRKIAAQRKERQAEVRCLNAEFASVRRDFVGELHPRHPLAHYDSGRLTARGIEICYRLFDVGKSRLAVAYMTNLSIVAINRHHRNWLLAGGPSRQRPAFHELPKRRFYRQHDD